AGDCEPDNRSNCGLHPWLFRLMGGYPGAARHRDMEHAAVPVRGGVARDIVHAELLGAALCDGSFPVDRNYLLHAHGNVSRKVPRLRNGGAVHRCLPYTDYDVSPAAEQP